MPFPGSQSKAARVCSVHVWAKECCDRSFCCVFALKKAKRKKCVSPWVGDDSSAWAAGTDHPFSCHQSQGRVFPWAVSSSECIAVLGERGTGSWGGFSGLEVGVCCPLLQPCWSSTCQLHAAGAGAACSRLQLAGTEVTVNTSLS